MDGKREKDEKLKQAIALEYDPSDAAPRVIASGRGILAAMCPSTGTTSWQTPCHVWTSGT